MGRSALARSTVEGAFRDLFEEKRARHRLQCELEYFERREDRGEEANGDDLELLPEARVEGAAIERLLSDLPKAASAYRFYLEEFNDRDRGAVTLRRLDLEGRPIVFIHVTTDGDDGWLEVYDHDDTLLGAARTYIEVIGWSDLDFVRRAVELDTRSSFPDGMPGSAWLSQPLDPSPTDPVAALGGRREGTRLAALLDLAQNAPPDPPVAAVAALLQDDHTAVRTQAAVTLAAFGEAARPAIGALTSATTGSYDLGVRVAARRTLAALGVDAPRSESELCRGLSHRQVDAVLLGNDLEVIAIAVGELTQRGLTPEELYRVCSSRIDGVIRKLLRQRGAVADPALAARADQTLLQCLELMSRAERKGHRYRPAPDLKRALQERASKELPDQPADFGQQLAARIAALPG
jgi:hypothetical protein